MRENRYDKLLLVSIILIILSTVLLAISGYNIFFKNNHFTAASSKNNSAKNPSPFRDSLQKIYNSTLSDITDNLLIKGEDKNDAETTRQIDELNTLRSEITVLLANKSNSVDLELAKVKIEELQQKVSFLQSKYSNAETENQRLQKLIAQLLKVKTGSDLPGNVIREKTISSTDKAGGKPAVAASLHLFAVANKDNNENETTNAENAAKMVGTFVVKNLSAKSNGEVMVVVLQPDGKVIKNSVWDSGTFETSEGKKIYSRKINIDTGADEKQLNFSLTPERFLKGDYTMQIWYNGNMIGKMIKTLS